MTDIPAKETATSKKKNKNRAAVVLFTFNSLRQEMIYSF
jgi:hypothetical protein